MYESLLAKLAELNGTLKLGGEKPFRASLNDAAEGLFLSKQLNHVRAKTFDIRYPEMATRKFISKASDIPAGAETFTTYSYDEIGMAEIITGDVKDLPAIEAKANEGIGKVQWIGASYGWSLIEMIRASFAGVPSSRRRPRSHAAPWRARKITSSQPAEPRTGRPRSRASRVS